MKKLLFTAILSCLLLPCFSNAGQVKDEIVYLSTGSCTWTGLNNYCELYNTTVNGGDNNIYCIEIQNVQYTNQNSLIKFLNVNNPGSTNNSFYQNYASNYNNYVLCLKSNGQYLTVRDGGSSAGNSFTINYKVYNLSTVLNKNFPSQYTSLECQTEYNLIPIESVTASYCKLNYDLIEPTECPINTGTGDISRTPRFINNSQYPGTALLRISIPDYIGFSVTYNTGESYLEIEGLNADTNYIENVINNEKLTPTNEDFEKLIGGLATFIPYLFIALLIIRMVKLFNKIWK